MSGASYVWHEQGQLFRFYHLYAHRRYHLQHPDQFVEQQRYFERRNGIVDGGFGCV